MHRKMEIYDGNSMEMHNRLKIFLRSNLNFLTSNEVSTRHDMNYGQVRYPTLVDKLINFTKAEPLFGT